MSVDPKSSAGSLKLMEDSFSTAKNHFNNAVEFIDSKFGEGYSKNNPELIAAFMQSSVIEYSGTAIAISLCDIRDQMKGHEENYDRVCSLLELHSEDIKEIRDILNME